MYAWVTMSCTRSFFDLDHFRKGSEYKGGQSRKARWRRRGRLTGEQGQGFEEGGGWGERLMYVPVVSTLEVLRAAMPGRPKYGCITIFFYANTTPRMNAVYMLSIALSVAILILWKPRFGPILKGEKGPKKGVGGLVTVWRAVRAYSVNFAIIQNCPVFASTHFHPLIPTFLVEHRISQIPGGSPDFPRPDSGPS